MDLARGTIRNHTRRRETVSPVSLAALVTALHFVLLTGRISPWSPMRRPGTLLIWRAPGEARVAAAAGEPEKGASRPTQTYAAGQLALAVGMSLVAMARWLHIMRLTGTHGH
jgi:hypothetical protein